MIGRMSLPLAIVLALGAIALPGAALAARPDNSFGRELPGRTVEIRAGTQPVLAPHAPRTSRASAQAAMGLADEPTADIQVSYSGFTAQAQASFEAAVGVWERTLVSDIPIHVSASWTPLGSGVLGSAGPNSFFIRNDGLAYPAALAEALCVCERETAHEIEANFNSSFSNWYLGTDGNTPANKYDFYSVVLHELGHGLGFISSFGVDGLFGYWGLWDGSKYVALRYDTYEMSAATGGSALMSFPNDSSILRAELTDGSVFFAGPNAMAAAGARVKLYAPSPWQGGSSNSHIDEAKFATGTTNALMTPALSPGEALHAPGPITVGMLEDIGWSTTPIAPTPAPANDEFGSASQIGAFPFEGATVNNLNATHEGEPQPSCSSVANTVWYRLQPTEDNSVTFEAMPGSNLNVVMAVYDGVSMETLAEVACADAATAGGDETETVTVLGGHTYYVQVGGLASSGTTGTFTLRATSPGAPPANDNVADAPGLALGVASNADTTGATIEVGEPNPACVANIANTVWYRFVATRTRRVIATTAGSNFDTVIGVYVGADVASLVPVTCNNDRAIDFLSKKKFKVFAGSTYWFQVGGNNGAAGSLKFTLKKA